MLTEADINLIADKVAQRLANKINENKKQEFNPDNNGRYTFQDGNGDVYDLNDYMRRPAVIDMTEDGCGCFYLIFNRGMASHWIGSDNVVKDFDEMVEFLTDELQSEFKITQF